MPIPAGEKAPPPPGWETRDHLYSRDEMNAWSGNAAVKAGLSCLVIVDLDEYKPGYRADEVAALGLPETYEVRSPRGGRHLYYEVPGGIGESVALKPSTKALGWGGPRHQGRQLLRRGPGLVRGGRRVQGDPRCAAGARPRRRDGARQGRADGRGEGPDGPLGRPHELGRRDRARQEARGRRAERGPDAVRGVAAGPRPARQAGVRPAQGVHGQPRRVRPQAAVDPGRRPEGLGERQEAVPAQRRAGALGRRRGGLGGAAAGRGAGRARGRGRPPGQADQGRGGGPGAGGRREGGRALQADGAAWAWPRS